MPTWIMYIDLCNHVPDCHEMTWYENSKEKEVENTKVQDENQDFKKY